MKSEELQKLLPLGYLFLVIVGIVKDSVFYYQLGINILSYSAIMDILISPIAEFTSNPIIFIAIFSLLLSSNYLPSLILKYRERKSVYKTFELQKIEGLSTTEVESYLRTSVINFLATLLLSFFLGYGFYGGFSISKNIKNNKIEYSYKLTYNTGESEQINLIGNNSLYYFYTVKGNKNIKITPLGAIKNIELTNNRMFK